MWSVSELVECFMSSWKELNCSVQLSYEIGTPSLNTEKSYHEANGPPIGAGR